METRDEFETRLTDEENGTWTQAKALIEIAWQLYVKNRFEQTGERLAQGKQVDPYAMEGSGVELEGPARL